MRFVRVQRFKEDFERLPVEIQNLVKEKFKLFQENPNHPSFRVKKMQGVEGIWEGHITREYVFTFERRTDETTGEEILIFRRIGTHAVYKKP